MKIIPSKRSNSGGDVLAVRHSSQVDIYWIDSWTQKASFTGLSCGANAFYATSGVEIDPTNSWFLTAGASGTGVYDLSTGAELFLFSGSPCRPSISKDGAYIAFADVNDVYIYETTTWTQETTFDPVDVYSGLVFAWSY